LQKHAKLQWTAKNIAPSWEEHYFFNLELLGWVLLSKWTLSEDP